MKWIKLLSASIASIVVAAALGWLLSSCQKEVLLQPEQMEVASRPNFQSGSVYMQDTKWSDCIGDSVAYKGKLLYQYFTTKTRDSIYYHFSFSSYNLRAKTVREGIIYEIVADDQYVAGLRLTETKLFWGVMVACTATSANNTTYPRVQTSINITRNQAVTVKIDNFSWSCNKPEK